MYKQNLSVMGVASCRRAFLCLISCVRLVSFRISVRDWISFNGRACSGFRSAVWPSPAQSGPVRPACPPPPDPFASFDFSCAVTSLSLFHLSLSPRGALGFGVEIARVWIPGGEFFPSPSLFSLSPPPPLLLLRTTLLPARPAPPRSQRQPRPRPCAPPVAAPSPVPRPPCPGEPRPRRASPCAAP
jgi:hypothetical protein